MKFKIVSCVLFHLMIALWERQAITADMVVLRESMEKKGRAEREKGAKERKEEGGNVASEIQDSNCSTNSKW